MKKPYRRESLQFTRENLNLRFNISWGRLPLDFKILKDGFGEHLTEKDIYSNLLVVILERFK